MLRSGSQTLLMHVDEYERHQFCYSRLAHRSLDKILDVGGTDVLKKFLPATRIISLNIDASGDVIYSGASFPFEDHSFDAVVSLDTLEHIPRRNRQNFIEECIRIARSCIIIAAPYGSAAHAQAEASLCEYLNQAQHPNRWLAEHVENGLPSPEEVLSYKKLMEDHHFATDTCYAGSYVWQIQNTKLAVRLQKYGLPGRVANLISFVLGLRIWHPVEFLARPTPVTNRFYLSGIKRSAEL